jgi:hypothetical protein
MEINISDYEDAQNYSKGSKKVTNKCQICGENMTRKKKYCYECSDDLRLKRANKIRRKG